MTAPCILCVDDDADILLVLEFSLRQVGGFEVRLCGGAEAALAELERFRPDLILLDVMMPRVSGPQLLARLRESPATAGIPVVFMTAKAMPAELEELLQHGALGVIVKPFDAMRLPDDLRVFLERAGG
jgi:two-component system OmpR family response regulator